MDREEEKESEGGGVMETEGAVKTEERGRVGEKKGPYNQYKRGKNTAHRKEQRM